MSIAYQQRAARATITSANESMMTDSVNVLAVSCTGTGTDACDNPT